jgi:glycosyltransferase involved in cell wall biosynthesis
MVDFTVAICTFNGEKRLPDVLEKLRSQKGTEEIAWEILVIDNNSTDGTADLVQSYLSKWTEPYALKYYFEAEQGLAFARRCAIRAAKSELIGFLDDDNLPYPSWVAKAYKFGQAYPNIGAYSGQVHGQFEADPPVGFERIAGLFALVEAQKTYCFNHKFKKTSKKVFPPGAGIVVRRKAWLASVPDRPQLNQIGEDIEFLSALFNSGWELWFNAEMEIDHAIPQSRLSKEYLDQFLFKNGLYRHPVRMFNYQPWQQPIATFFHLINDLKKVILHTLKYQSTIKIDPVTSAERSLLLGSLLSPFFYLKNVVFKM